ncbi:uncharacterized protein LOC144749914 [Ciona intestinalis]
MVDVKTHHRGKGKRLMAKPTLEGHIFTTQNFISLTKRLLSSSSLEYVCLHSFTQDVLGAFFGNLRQIGRRSGNPDVSQAAYGIQHITVRKVIKNVKGLNGSTTFDKENAWTEVSDIPLPKR